MIKATRILVLIWAVLLLGSPSRASMTVTLQQGLSGYSGCTDAWLDESLVRDNYGGAANVRVQWNSGRSDCTVMKFVLTGAIPPGSTIVSATLSLWYYDCGSFVNDNAMTIKPFRLQAGAWWDENVYDGVLGHGVSYRYRDANESYQWTGGADGGWSDKLDDGNGIAKIKKTGGTPPDALPPQNWISFDVTPSVEQWFGGATNHGFLLVATDFVGSGSIGYGLFISRNDTGVTYCPKLAITYDAPVPARATSWGRIKDLFH